MIIIITLIVIQGVRGLDIPAESLSISNAGVVIEPEALLTHYDEVYYLSVGMKLGFHLNAKHNPEMQNCSGVYIITKLLSESEKTVDEFFDTIPSHFGTIDESHCRFGTLSCSMNMSAGKQKRSVVMAGALIAGVAAAGIGLYHYLTMAEIKTHLEEVDTHLSKLDHTMMALDDSDSQYKKLSANIIQKIWHGSENIEHSIQKLGCRDVSAATELNTRLHLTHYNEVAQDAINKGIDGELSSFILSSKYIKEEILTLPLFKGSIYHEDIGMFYRAASTFLTRSVKKSRTLVFLIAIPVIRMPDIAPMYRLTNIGYWDNEHFFKYTLPEFFYFLKGGTDQHVATPNLDKCRHKSGVYICSIRDSAIDSQALCLNELLRGAHSTTCLAKVQKQPSKCVFKMTRSGVIYNGCSDIRVFQRYGQLSAKKLSNTPSSGYIPYQNFSYIHLGDHEINSRTSYFEQKYMNVTNLIQTGDIENYTGILADGLEYDIQKLDSISKQRLSHVVPIISTYLPWNLLIAILGLIILTLLVCVFGVYHLQGNRRRHIKNYQARTQLLLTARDPIAETLM